MNLLRLCCAALLALLPVLGFANEPLEPEQAFRFSSRVVDANTVEVRYQIADGHYLYRDKFHFASKTPGITLGPPKLPAPQVKQDEFLGRMEIYHGSVAIRIPVKRADNTVAQTLALEVSSQGCAEAGICYPPVVSQASLKLPSATPAAPSAPPAGKTAAPEKLAAEPAAPQSPPTATTAAESDESRVASLFKQGSFWPVIASFFGFGLLLSLTPCVFPMIPILSGIIVGQGKHASKTQGFLLSLSYVLGMAVTYAIAGVAAGLSGTLLSNALQTPWVLGAFAALFALLALSMFGFYELQMPSALQSRFNERANRMQGGNFAGVFIMGVLSALIVGPCVAAPLAGALLYIGKSHDVWLGGSALFSMALGMGVPLLIVGLSAGALLPRAGAWMSAVKGFFGVLLLAMAVWIISPVIPAAAAMLAWAALLMVSAIYLHALDPLPPNASGMRKFWKGVGVIALVTGAAVLLGVLSGNRDILQPLAGLRLSAATPAQAAEVARLPFQRIQSVADLDARLAQAKGQPVMLDFYADWCVSCKELERFTFSDPRVQAKLKGVLLLQADVTRNSADDKALLQRFNLFGPPGILFFDRQGKEIPGGRVVGYEPPEKFLQRLDQSLR